MEKISPPLRIALVAVMLLAVAWFLVLRPKPPADEPATPPPGVAGLSNDVQRAQSATATANAAATSAQNSAASVDAANGASATATKSATATAAEGTSSKGAVTKSTESATVTGANGGTVTATKKTTKAVARPTTPAKPKAVVKPKAPAKPKVAADPAAPLVAALKRDKAVILLFRNSSSDSQAVADAVRAVPKQVKRVVVRVAPIGQVGRYATFTEKTPISQAPTVLVIGPGRRAKVIVGYTSTAEVAEAVGDLRRAAKR